VTALTNVSLSVARGESFGLVGESGSGKTTLTRCILRLDQPTSGRILFEGEDMAQLSPAALAGLRARIQIVFQDPYASLNPRMSVHDIVTEPMLIHRAAGAGRTGSVPTGRPNCWRSSASARSISIAIRTSFPAASASASASPARSPPTLS
jgi:ABC-type glutathione transport system ATPase component